MPLTSDVHYAFLSSQPAARTNGRALDQHTVYVVWPTATSSTAAPAATAATAAAAAAAAADPACRVPGQP